MSIATTFVPRVARMELIPVRAVPFQFPRQIDSDLTLIGSGEACDISLSCGKVDPAHAALVRIGPTMYLCDLGSPAGTSLNDRRIRSERVTQGSIISIGSCDFRVQMVGDGPLQSAIPVFKLHRGQNCSATSSQDGLILIGSDPACDLVLGDSDIAARHALVAWTTHGPMLRDLVGAYSVRRNGRKVRASLLNNGDKIGVGAVEFKFESDHPPIHEPGDLRLNLAGPELTLSRNRLTHTKSAIPETSVALATNLKGLRGTLDRGKSFAKPAGRGAKAQHVPCSSAEKKSDRIDAALCLELKEIGQSSERFKARVAAAQLALDQRARKLMEGLNEERQRISSHQGELGQKARQLRGSTIEKNKANVTAVPACEEPKDAPQIDGPSGPEKTAAVDWTSRTEVQSTGADLPIVDETSPAVLEAESRSLATDIQEQAAQLAELVRRERQEMDEAEARFGSLRFEIERLRSNVARTSERHRIRQNELDSRTQKLRRGQQALDTERDSLEARLRQLEAKRAALQIRVHEADQQQSELEQEERQLTQAREQLELRRNELRSNIEAERQRLRLRQAELQSKAGELARIARERREGIEARVSQEHAALEEHEKKIRAQRQAIEAASRCELDRTAGELEQVLCSRLSDIETEFTTRQTDLNNWMESIADQNVDASIVGPTPRSVEEPPLVNGELMRTDIRKNEGRLVDLQKEIGDLQHAIRGMGSNPEAGVGRGKTPSPSSAKTRRWSSTMKTRLSEKIATLRTKPVELQHHQPQTIPLVGEDSEKPPV